MGILGSFWKKGKNADEPMSPQATLPQKEDCKNQQTLTQAKAQAQVALKWNVGDVILDLYEVTGILGEGGMGKVYKVHHRGWNVDLAVKSPKPEIFSQAGGLDNFERECETWVNLGLHPNTVSCYYVRRFGGVPLIFAEYVEGGSLKDWIEEKKLYEGDLEKALERMLDIAIQFSWGLHYAHEEGLVHQDVKPANVMMTSDGTVKITDFGLAKARAAAGESIAGMSQKTVLVSSGDMTPAYCSPEQARGEKLSRRTDIWSWGLSILHMFTGGVTWMAGQAAPGALEGYLATRISDENIPKMPENLAGVLRRCFQHKIEKRPKDMLEIATTLQQIYQEKIGRQYPREAPKSAEALADSLNNHSLSLLDLGKNEQAEKLFEEALRIHPGHPRVTYNHGLLLWRNSRIADDALVTRMEEAARHDEQNWAVPYLLGWVHLERGDAESAVKFLTEATKRGGNRQVEDALSLAQAGLIETARYVRTFEGDTGGAASLDLSVDDRWVLSGIVWGLGGIKLWETSTGKCIRTFDKPKIDAKSYGLIDIKSVCLSADSRWALTGSADGSVLLWEVATGQRVRSFEGHSSIVWSVCLSSDGRWAISGSEDKTLRLWKVTTGECVRTFQGHTGRVTSVCLSSDSQWAISGSGGWLQAQDTTLAYGMLPQAASYGDLKVIVMVSRRFFSVTMGAGSCQEAQIGHFGFGKWRRGSACGFSKDTPMA